MREYREGVRVSIISGICGSQIRLESPPWMRCSSRRFAPNSNISGFVASGRFVEPLIVHATQGLTRPRLLDAGCGTGRNYPLLEKYGVPLGLELSSRGLRYARERGLPRLTQGSVTDLPFASASIDVVLSFDVLYSLHPDAERAAIHEMFRVLRPRGFVIVNVAALPSLTGDHSALAGEVHRYVRPELRAKIDERGISHSAPHIHERLVAASDGSGQSVSTASRGRCGRGGSRGLLRAAGAGECAIVRSPRGGIERHQGRARHAARQFLVVSGAKTLISGLRENRKSAGRACGDPDFLIVRAARTSCPFRSQSCRLMPPAPRPEP